MACDYQAIRADNERRYGTDIGRIGPMLLADRYDDRTHFIFELLQNAEDALARRCAWKGPRSVKFHLTKDALRVSHFGQPFDEADVRGICGIAESTKDLTAIGRFGIGFKSVYAFTDRPEVHSGTEDFAIESFVWPVAVSPLDSHVDETVIAIPLRASDEAGHDEVAAGLERLGASALLFLRQIEEIHWSVEGGRSGLYLRELTEVDAGVRRVTVIGQERGETEVDEEWLVFSRPVTADGEHHPGYVEIAFCLVQDEESQRETVQRVGRSPLVVFFPTVLETHLGFLVQGPYRTTPSRDNVPRSDSWNQRLVGETAWLLVEALRWLRDHDLLDTAALRCLPLDSAKFGETSMFAPLFGATKRALSSEPLLPRFDTGHVTAACARLARTQELRELFAPSQLAPLLAQKQELAWLSGDITQDRAPELRRYLMQELDVAEITPETIVPRLDKAFLQAQPDAWILDLYQFLNSQPALRRRLEDLPLIRLEDGNHVPPGADGQPQAFLPSTITTAFPTVRASVCATEPAREFLRSLGLTEPDPVDDVVRNVLPKYRKDTFYISDPDYETDIRRILTAFAADSKVQREKLIAALGQTTFVVAVDASDRTKWVAKPGEVYLATERLKELFAGVARVLLVDDSYPCLRGEEVRELFEACGATRHLQPVAAASTFTWEQLREMRVAAGCESMSWAEPIEDMTLRGLDPLLALITELDSDRRSRKAALLWEALGELEAGRSTGVFSGAYHWHYYQRRNATFDAAFVRKLNETAWVPDGNGELQRPEFVLFDTLGWQPDPFLQSKIRFKPPIIETLAKEAGIDPGVLVLLKKLGVTSEADLRSKLGLPETEPTQTNPDPGPQNVDDALKALLGGDVPAPTPPVPDASSAEPQESSANGRGGSGGGVGHGAGGGHGSATGDGADRTGESRGASSGGAKRTAGSPGGRPFISYVGTHPDDEEPDPDGLDQAARMALEEKAIAFILQSEPQLQRTPAHNPGFDLFEPAADGQAARWVEVKAMTGSLNDRPVGLSRKQFECAQMHGAAYRLYVVEHAGQHDGRIVRIQDPAGKARTFTFDHGWLSVADENLEQEHRED
jgi:hypothetical protein